jgi:hypothetical protein
LILIFRKTKPEPVEESNLILKNLNSQNYLLSIGALCKQELGPSLKEHIHE